MTPRRDRFTSLILVFALLFGGLLTAQAADSLPYVHHTDAEREWAYGRQSNIGRLDKGLDEAREKGWTVVDMKQDWKIIYPFERP